MKDRIQLGPDLACDVATLIDTRLLVQANSGGGKSWALRRLLELTHGKVQHLVIDPEGEFSSLREKFDYVVAAKTGGDTAADPRSAKLLAEKLLELGASAILDIYELKHHDRIRFVRAFLEALVDAPKTLWHPALVVVDEAHVFCPQQGEAESAGAVIDLATRGRKRGYCAVLATQRISKLHKDAAAELNNKLIGRTALDVDMKRAGDELGFTTREQLHGLRALDAGEFFAFGPAIGGQGVVRGRIGPVQTSHPKAGARLAVPTPPPTSRIRALLPKLADLPAEAAQRAESIEQLRKDLATTRRELTIAQKSGPTPAPPKEKIVERVVEVVPASLKQQVAALRRISRGTFTEEMIAGLAETARMIREIAEGVRTAKSATFLAGPGTSPAAPRAAAPNSRYQEIPRSRPVPKISGNSGTGDLSGPEQRVLNALAELEAMRVSRPERVQVAFLAGYTNLNSKGFANAMGALSSAGRITYPGAGTVQLTDDGRQMAHPVDVPRTVEELQERVLRMLDGPGARILRPLLDAYPRALTRGDLGEASGYGNLNSKGFANAMGRLRSLGFIDYPATGQVVAARVLFLEGDD